MNQSNKLYKRAVVLGAAGFIGVPLVKSLVQLGYEVVCFDQASSPHWPVNVKSIIGRFVNLPIDLLESLNNATVYHLVSSTRPSQNADAATRELVFDVSSMLSYLEQTRCRNLRWVFASSGGTVYGPEALCPIAENSATDPSCSYGIAKLAIEKYFALYKRLYGTDYVIARLANPYGPGQDPFRGQGVIAALVYKALIGEAAEIWGNGEVVRDYIYIDDLVRGLITVSMGKKGEIYNIGSGVGVSINGLIDKIQSTLNIEMEIRYLESRSIDVSKNILDSSRLIKSLGWNPSTSLKDGILKSASWINVQYNKTL